MGNQNADRGQTVDKPWNDLKEAWNGLKNAWTGCPTKVLHFALKLGPLLLWTDA